MELLYKDILDKGQYNINKNQFFGHLSEEDEIYVTREIVNLILWVNTNIDIVNDFLKTKNISLYKENGEISRKSIIEFWLQYLGKSDRLENLLEGLGVIADIQEFFNSYYIKLSKFSIPFDFKMVSYSNYRTKEQYELLNKVINENSYRSTQVITYLTKNKMDIDHIDKNTAQNIISKLKL